MNIAKLNIVNKGFIEAMYFADGADADFMTDDGFYMDGSFNQDFNLSSEAKQNIADLIKLVLPKLPVEVFNLSCDRIGQCIYYEVMGYGVGFCDEMTLSDDVKEIIYQLFYNSFYCDIGDNYNDEIHFSYSVKGVI